MAKNGATLTMYPFLRDCKESPAHLWIITNTYTLLLRFATRSIDSG